MVAKFDGLELRRCEDIKGIALIGVISGFNT